MKCINHPNREAAGICSYSGKPFCQEELIEFDSKLYGKEYINKAKIEANKVAALQIVVPIIFFIIAVCITIACALFNVKTLFIIFLVVSVIGFIEIIVKFKKLNKKNRE
jgi:hypothetical protein